MNHFIMWKNFSMIDAKLKEVCYLVFKGTVFPLIKLKNNCRLLKNKINLIQSENFSGKMRNILLTMN